MPLTLVATAGASNANSYATRGEGDTYHEAHYYSDTWADAGTGDKEEALVQATRMLDTYFEWRGIVATQAQALGWPRISAYDRQGRLLSGSTIPADVRDATAELARWILDSDRTAEASSASGEIQEIKVGPIDIKYTPGSATDTPVIPDVVVAMLRHLGTYKSGTGGAISVYRG